MILVRWINRLNKILIVLLALAFIIMTISIFLQVLVRFVFTALEFRISMPWTEELARYLMIWAVFVGGAVALRKDKLIALEMLVHSIPSYLGKIIKITALSVSIIFFIYLLFIGLELALQQGNRQISPVMGIPMKYVYLAMPVGAILAIINIMTLFVETYITKKDIRYIAMEEEHKEIGEEIEQTSK